MTLDLRLGDGCAMARDGRKRAARQVSEREAHVKVRRYAAHENLCARSERGHRYPGVSDCVFKILAQYNVSVLF